MKPGKKPTLKLVRRAKPKAKAKAKVVEPTKVEAPTDDEMPDFVGKWKALPYWVKAVAVVVVALVVLALVF